MTSVVFRRAGAIFLLTLLVAGCAGSGRYNDGPDEFMVLPTKPLQTPASYSQLPEPTPGGTNLADPAPKAEAVAALGGQITAYSALGGIPAVDGALINQVSRFGMDPDVRATLAKANGSGRKSGRGFFLTRWLSRGGLFGGFGSQTLDPFAENARLRAAGIKTPSAPPVR